MLWAKIHYLQLYNVICFKLKTYLIYEISIYGMQKQKLHMDFTKQISAHSYCKLIWH